MASAGESHRGLGFRQDRHFKRAAPNSDNQFVAVPRLARNVLEVVNFTDGGLTMTATPRIVSAANVGELIEALTDQRRRGPVLVAGTDGSLPFDRFVKSFGTWTREVTGLGNAIVLDPAATEELTRQIGTTWATPPWTVRTYLPGLDPGEPYSARQHRMLGTERLGSERDPYLRKMLGGFARSITSSRAIPTDLVAWRRKFDRLENAAIAKAIKPAAPAGTVTDPPAPEPAAMVEIRPETAALEIIALRATLRRVQEALDLPNFLDASLRELLEASTAPRVEPEALEDAAKRIQDLQDENEFLQLELDEQKGAHEDLQLDFLEIQEQLGDAERRVSWLDVTTQLVC